MAAVTPRHTARDSRHSSVLLGIPSRFARFSFFHVLRYIIVKVTVEVHIGQVPVHLGWKRLVYLSYSEHHRNSHLVCEGQTPTGGPSPGTIEGTEAQGTSIT